MTAEEVDALKELAEDFRRNAASAAERGERNYSEWHDVSGYDRCEGKRQGYIDAAQKVEQLLQRLQAS